jgi:hypothetical protein
MYDEYDSTLFLRLLPPSPAFFGALAALLEGVFAILEIFVIVKRTQKVAFGN